MRLGPIQTGIFCFVIAISVVLGLFERWGNVFHSPDAFGLASALFSSGLVALIALLGAEPF